ncbi:endonuclease/exonuclease/phosphatase family protein [Lacisediminihabitans profunda]|uniref:Endonuclease/exonuclease/phosphatase family protein n=1 Tax=Lacisediminihabitans profunda TaxID=2594790 RepID=A0A5C8UUA3_9MICO|nr:endonuclease/exonuclease/phosphatase family protein [Lacisediminihabitans profunda]TXN31216.1 endonuclease/exonuclease/phosphatase family protein [Lacisediminihabitans profunda]
MFRRVLAAALLLLLAVVLLIAAWPQLFGLQRTSGLAQLISFRGAMVVAAVGAMVVVGVAAALNRPFRRLGASIVLLLGVFAFVTVAVLASRGLGNETFAAKSRSDLTVVSWNTLGGSPGAATIATLALGSDADIVSLPETTKSTADAVAALLKASGRPMSVHTLTFDRNYGSRSTSVLVSEDLGEYHLDKTAGSTSTVPTVVILPNDGHGPTIVAVHPIAPVEGEMRNWRSDLRWLSGACDSKNVIMAGDFNATIDHLAGFVDKRGKTLGGCSDAGVQSGNGAVGTWPSSIPALAGASIDHVMATANWRVTGMRVVTELDGTGSDHRPIVVQLHALG